MIERLTEFLSLIVAILHFPEARGEPSVAERPVGPFHKILSTIVVFEALQREGRNQAGQFVQTGCFYPQLAFLGSEGEPFPWRQRHVEIFVEMTDVGHAPDGRTHADDFPAAEQGAAHGDLIEGRILQAADGTVGSETVSDLIVREAGQEAVVESGEHRLAEAVRAIGDEGPTAGLQQGTEQRRDFASFKQELLRFIEDDPMRAGFLFAHGA